MTKPITPPIKKVTLNQKPRTMDFPDAIRRIAEGKKVRRVSWPEKDYGVLKDGWLKVFTKDRLFIWNVNDGDIEGQDWVVIEEGN